MKRVQDAGGIAVSPPTTTEPLPSGAKKQTLRQPELPTKSVAAETDGSVQGAQVVSEQAGLRKAGSNSPLFVRARNEQAYEDTRLARSMMYGMGAFDQIAADPKVARRLVDQMIDVARSRIDESIELFAVIGPGRPDEMDGMLASSGYENLPGGPRTESLYRRDLSYPFPIKPTPLMFFGSEVSGHVRAALHDLILHMDASLSDLQQAHFQFHTRERVDQITKMVDLYEPGLKEIPEAQRPAATKRVIEREVAKIGDEYRPITGNPDVTELLQALPHLSPENCETYDSTRAMTEKAELLADVLPKLTQAETHRLVADAALSILGQSLEPTGPFADRLETARLRLKEALVGEGPSEEVRAQSAEHLKAT